MKVPCRWLQEYVDLGLSLDLDVECGEIGLEQVAADLAERLTLAGLEVEEMSSTGSISKTVIGRTIRCEPHPDSDHLSVCQVDVGDETLQIVCGAANVAAGQTVIVAKVDAVLPGGFKIGSRKLRGVASQGMICSKAELGLEDASPGIWVLPDSAGHVTGTDVNDLLEYDDIILDIKVTSNRPDCAGMVGIAREVAAIYRRPLRPLETTLTETGTAASDEVSVRIADPADAPRYTARLMSALRVAESPLWLQHRLAKAGMRPRSNVVDATNYVMHELGKPLHAFDADLLSGDIEVRRARDGEVFRTLDDTDRAIGEAVLMITDGTGNLAIAGVMGGARSEIRDTTKRVLLEAATFDPKAIRRSSRALGLRSEASQRYERGIDADGVGLASIRATHLIQKLTGCTVHPGVVDTYPVPEVPERLSLRPSRIARVLGVEIGTEQTLDILERLGMTCRLSDSAPDGVIEVAVPLFRRDLKREIDLIEEVGRIYGFERIPATPPMSVLRVGKKDPREQFKDRVRGLLVGQGFEEVVQDGFDKPAWRKRMALDSDDLVPIRNPMQSDQSLMRGSLLPGVLHVVESNLKHQVGGGMIFEVGHVFSASRGERDSLAGALFGRRSGELAGKRQVDLMLEKGVLLQVCQALGVGVEALGDSTIPFLHPGRSGILVRTHGAPAQQPVPIGVFGELAPDLRNEFPGEVRVLVFELDLASLYEASSPLSERTFRTLPRFPLSIRDLSLIVPAAVREADVRKAIVAEPVVESVILYDLYEGEQVAAGSKSLTYEIALRSADGTLTDEQTASIVGRIEARLAEFGASLRSR
ncbi:phenylalanine--tRNA ligase subunit beta [Candidatus Bipolaricaulota bacterium]|nr:phenylalanine--tRNA ligase subunit beta [Candidatus Bipolaricaulota bacterium]